MFDIFPEEMIINIIKNIEDNNHHLEENIFFQMDFNQVLLLKRVNRRFRDIISSLENSWLLIPDKHISKIKTGQCNKLLEDTSNIITIKKERSKKLDELCKKNTSTGTFKWLMKNNIFFSLSNIKNLIINNRIDVIKSGFFYKEFLDLLFNRFYIDNTKNTDIFTITENMNPIIIAAEYNRLEIVKLLLECSNHGNPFLNMIPSLLDISIKYTNKTLLSYLINKYPNKIQKDIELVATTILFRFQKSEDIMFHLLQNKQIEITRKTIIGAISKNYYDFFVHCYNNYKNEVKNNNQDYIIKCVEVNSINILNFLLSNGSNINKTIFSNVFFKKKKNDKSFIENIIKNHQCLISKEKPLIRLSIENGIENELLIMLINNGYTYNEEDIINSINNKNIELSKHMINNFC